MIEKGVNQIDMSAQNSSLHLKAGLEILRDSFLIAVGLTFIVTLNQGAIRPFVVFLILVEILVYTTFIMFLAYGVFYRVHPLICDRPAKVQWTVFVVLMVAISGVGSVLGSLIVAALQVEPGMSVAALVERSFKISVIVSLLIGVNEAAFDRLRGQLEDTQLKLKTEELERERALKLASESRLGALESRLHPHFLFNTLNSISSLIPSNPERAERLLERMAALLRFTLESHKSGVVDLGQEMKIAGDYLEIEQARLGARLRYGFETRGDMEGVRLPPLSVQTLVENSIKFAVAPNREGGEIRVFADRRNGSLWVDVADTGPGFILESAPPGHGLDNLRSRLAVLFGESAELTVSQADGWTTVSMKVPV